MNLSASIVTLLALLLTSLSAQARSSDADQPLTIEADSVEIREQEGISIYNGNVMIRRGSTVIKGEKIRIQQKQGQIDTITIHGQPATFSQLNDLDQTISAQSQRMNYQAQNGILTLDGEAVLIQHNNRFTSEHIVYNANKDIVHAGQKTNTHDEDTPKRVTITISPDDKKTDTKP